jgi:NAD(P)-dependent dehydrogenase (short-subunit alcohol dehydrogenase family)
VLRHFSPLLDRQRALLAVLSAKVGSIGDNRLGGWYSYRASKAALNMLLATAAIEVKRGNPQAVLVSLHPGTVTTGLSKPFKGEQIGRPAMVAVQEMLQTLNPTGPRGHRHFRSLPRGAPAMVTTHEEVGKGRRLS